MAFYGYNGEVDWTILPGHDLGIGSKSHYSSPYYTGECEPNPIPIPIPFDYYKQDYSVSIYSDYKDDYSVSTYSDPINYASHDYYNYSVNEYYTQPKYLQYDPPPLSQGYFPSETKFTVSYSTVELGLPEFEEYDPTPYDGGYDQAMTYGKPVPPSDVTCYPRTLPGPPLENFSFDSIASPYGRDDDIITPPKPKTDVDDGGKAKDAVVEPRDVDDGRKVKDAAATVEVPFLSYDYPSHQHQNPYGSGLEAMDICESLFGYWPCLAKKEQQQRIHDCPVCHPADRRIDPWKSAADYLFGSPLPYGYDNHHHHHSLYQSDQIS